MDKRFDWEAKAATGHMIREKEQRFRRRIPSIPEVDCGLDAERVWHRDEFASVGVRGLDVFRRPDFVSFGITRNRISKSGVEP